MSPQQQQCVRPASTSTKKALHAMISTTLLSIAPMSSSFSGVKAFRPIHHVSNNNGPQLHRDPPSSSHFSSSSSSKLFYVVFGGDQDAVEQENNNYHGNSDYNAYNTFAIHENENEKSLWLESLQNLESYSTSSSNNSEINNDNCYSNDSCGLNAYGIWSRIACAFAPAPHDHLHPNMVQEAVLVQVSDTSLDIAVAVPAAPGSSYGGGEDQQLVQILITVEFPDGGASFKESSTAYTLAPEDKLSAVIHQVRLMERNANDRLLHEQVTTQVFEGASDPNYYDNIRNQYWNSN